MQHLLKASFRVGETVSKPILSLMEIIDNGAEVWLRRGNMKMYLNKDYENGISLARRHNTLGIEVVKFQSAQEAREYARTCAAVADDSGQAAMGSDNLGRFGAPTLASAPAARPVDFDDFEVDGEKSAPSGLSAEERLGGAAAPARPEPVPVAGEVLHPDSKVETMRARLRESD